MSSVVAYIDGFNLYYGLRQKNWKQFYWIDPHKLVESLVDPEDTLHMVKYFTARVNGDRAKRDRQTAYLDALAASSAAEIVFGKYYPKRRGCHQCGTRWQSYEEKMTDSAIASHIVADAFLGSFDKAILVGGDTDVVPAIRMVRKHFPNKGLEVWFPPARRNNAVEHECDAGHKINGDHLGRAVMPDTIVVRPGLVIQRPVEWAIVPGVRP